MKLNINFKDFKKNHIKKQNQIIFTSKKCNDYSRIENLFKFLLVEKNSFIFESVEKGIIKGFKAVLDNHALDRNHIAFTEVKLSDTRDSALNAFNKAVQGIPQIEQCHMIAGQFDYLLKVRTRNIADYRYALGEKISSLPCVANTSTHVVMESIKD